VTVVKPPKDCNDLGEAAADNIVHDAGLCHRFGATSNSLKKFRRECRSVAYGRCEGYITKALEIVTALQLVSNLSCKASARILLIE